MYRERIEKLASGYDPAHVEAYMRELSWTGIESLSTDRFSELAKRACVYIDNLGLEVADQVAKSFKLRPKKRAS